MNTSNNRWVIFMPVFLSVAVIFGVFIGQHLQPRVKSKNNKVGEILEIIHEKYVDTVNGEQLVEAAIMAIMDKLDPHSTYLPPIQQASAQEDLRGNFQGIGIEFNILEDTIVVVRTISGGPSEKKGLRPGDRIVKIDGELVAGNGIKNDDVLKYLRGDKGTEVNLGLARSGQKDLITITLTRDVIPIYSLDAAYMVNDKVGYIRLNKFSETTMTEYTEAFSALRAKGMERMILDLRDNPGGFLNMAIDLADEFLAKNALIVYTEDRYKDRKNYRATSAGKFEKNPLVVLIDEGSASASEIVAGALQDNDRATIIGRRSFGKGLVQEPIEMADGSAIRLTVSRYYTPVGRSIQKPYSEGLEKYYENALKLYDPSKDTNYQSASQKFTTNGGKTVYGGGGILPDIIVPHDTSGFNPYVIQVANKGIINDFPFEYADKNRTSLHQLFSSYTKFADNEVIDQKILAEFVKYAASKGVANSPEDVKEASALIISRVKPLIARNLWKNEAYFYVLGKYDPVFQKAMEEINP